MYTREMLLDLHGRTHSVLEKLLAHCRGLREEELNRRMEPFGFPTVAQQLQHEIGAERYWVGVLRGLMLVDEDEDAELTVDSLEALRAPVAAATVEYLRDATPGELNTPRTMTTWGGKRRELTPAHVVLRPLMHYFQHQGQILAMCRLLGKPVAGLDFPV